jgi:ectoine hydroxylase-related dioxygenase (phytanoyl-CoA dioxygenase family)
VSSLTERPLTEDDVNIFNDSGYFLYHRQVFGDDKLDVLSSIFEEHRVAQSDKRGDEFDTPHFEDRRLLDYLLAPEVLDLVECIIGPDILLWSSHFICKDPLVGRTTPWHEDSAYWMGRLDRYDKIVTVWLALDDVDRGNGCMEVIPGSHLSFGSSSYRPVDINLNTFNKEIADIDLSQAVPFELQRGECSLHDGRIRHGARPNASDRRRLGYTMRYLSARVTLVPERNAGHPTWLARGRAIAPNHLENAFHRDVQ